MHLNTLQLVSCVCLVAVAMTAPPEAAPPVHHVARRSFFNLQCKGVYDASIFAQLDRICDDCYNLFREPELYTLCRKKCFTSPFFRACMDSLYLQDDEKEQIDRLVDYVGKR